MPAVSFLVGDWSRRDVQLRSKLIFNSIRDQVALHLADETATKFDRSDRPTGAAREHTVDHTLQTTLD